MACEDPRSVKVNQCQVRFSRGFERNRISSMTAEPAEQKREKAEDKKPSAGCSTGKVRPAVTTLCDAFRKYPNPSVPFTKGDVSVIFVIPLFIKRDRKNFVVAMWLQYSYDTNRIFNDTALAAKGIYDDRVNDRLWLWAADSRSSAPWISPARVLVYLLERTSIGGHGGADKPSHQ